MFRWRDRDELTDKQRLKNVGDRSGEGVFNKFFAAENRILKTTSDRG